MPTILDQGQVDDYCAIIDTSLSNVADLLACLSYLPYMDSRDMNRGFLERLELDEPAHNGVSADAALGTEHDAQGTSLRRPAEQVDLKPSIDKFDRLMRQIPISRYQEESTRLFPGLQNLLGALDRSEDDQAQEGLRVFSSDVTALTDYRSVLSSINRAFRYAANIIREEGRPGKKRELTSLLEYLANSSRIDCWRLPLAAYGIVEACLNILADPGALKSDYILPSLRLLSNCCIDPLDDHSAGPAKDIIQSKIDLKATIPLLVAQATYKPCLFLIFQASIDDDAFQQSLVAYNLVAYLVRLLDRTCFRDDDVLDRTCEILRWPACERDLLEQGRQAMDAILIACKACSVSTEVLASATSLLTVLLEKGAIPTPNLNLSEILDFFRGFDVGSQGPNHESVTVQYHSAPGEDSDIEDDEEKISQDALKMARKQLTNALGQLATRPDFNDSFDIQSKAILTIFMWLSSDEGDLRICALVMIGNSMIESEAKRAEYVESTEILQQITNILSIEANGLVLRSAFEVVQILGKSFGIRRILGHCGIMEAMSRSWLQSTDIQLQVTALYHTRQLLQNCFSNIHHFLTVRSHGSASLLADLLFKVFQTSENDDVQLQCGLIIMTVWHTVLANPHESLEDPRDTRPIGPPSSAINPETAVDGYPETYFSHGAGLLSIKSTMDNMCKTHLDIILPFLTVIKSDNPSLATRAWLSLALMSKRACCEDALYHTLIEGAGSATFRAVLADQDEDSPKTASNARFLLHELMQRSATTSERFQVLSRLWNTLT